MSHHKLHLVDVLELSVSILHTHTLHLFLQLEDIIITHHVTEIKIPEDPYSSITLI